MAALSEQARAADITILNEVGLDPGIDHLLAMRVINDAQQRGGKLVSFVSHCGGLPAPEASDNPFGYKFSWAPRGVLVAGLNSARYKDNGRIVNIASGQLFDHVRAFLLLLLLLSAFLAWFFSLSFCCFQLTGAGCSHAFHAWVQLRGVAKP